MTYKLKNLSLLVLLAVSGAGWAGVDNPAATGQAPGFAAPAASNAAAKPKTSPEYDQAVNALRNKDLDQADKLFRQAMLKQPKSPMPVIGLAEVERLKGHDDESLRLLRKAVELAPADARSRVVLGTALYLRGRAPEAEKELLKAAELEPKAQLPLMALADLYFNAMKRPDKAAEYYGRVIKMNPDIAPAQLGQGMAFLAMKDFEHAAPALEKARSLAPTSPQPLMALSQLQVAQGNVKAAIGSLQEAAKLAPLSEDIQLRLGMYYQQEKQWPEAYTAYETALRLNDKLVVAYNNLAWMAADRKERLDDAERWGAKAVQLFPNEASLKDTYAWVKRARGDNKAALALLESITSSGTPAPDYFYHLGVVREESGQKTEAVAAYKRALQISPKFAQADDARQRLAKLE